MFILEFVSLEYADSSGDKSYVNFYDDLGVTREGAYCPTVV